MSTMMLDAREAKVWELHMSGMPMSEIAAATHFDLSYIRDVITWVWRQDGKAVKHAA